MTSQQYWSRLGAIIFSLAVIGLGLIHLIGGNFPLGLLPVPDWVPYRLALAYLTGAALLVLGIGLVLKKRWAALGAGWLFLLFASLIHLPRWVVSLSDGRIWTALFELISLAGGAFLLADTYGQPRPDVLQMPDPHPLAWWGRLLFTAGLVVFGGLHVAYGPFIATLIPAWIPAPLFWAYFVGVAFWGTAISLFLPTLRPWATALLGLMFLLWVLLLHAPRVVANPHVEPEWTSLCIALAMNGVAVYLAGFSARQESDYQTVSAS